ncbi:MAG: hypothetical protein WCE51_06425 [Chthoniobacterales bacterium]
MFSSKLPRIDFGRGFSKASFALCAAALLTGSSLFAQEPAYAAETTVASSPQSGSPSTKTKNAQTKTLTESTSEPDPVTLVESTMVITGDELPSAYGAPGAFSRSRFSGVTTAYVLPPWEVYSALIYEGDSFNDSLPDNLFTQEIELGLPYRFGLAMENRVEHFNGETQDSFLSVEARYALADWNKIPLNPTLFAEYKFGIGNILHDEGPPPPPGEEEEGGPPPVPNAYEFRLMLAQEFGSRFEWAANVFFERENTGDRGREWGFSQSLQTPIFAAHERLKVGVDMIYKNFTVKDTRGSPINRFNIGPSVSFKPSARMRFDLEPLFGVTKDSPAIQVFAIVSYIFGGGGEHEAEGPASTQNR